MKNWVYLFDEVDRIQEQFDGSRRIRPYYRSCQTANDRWGNSGPGRGLALH
jgi:hypothetical protein